MKITRAMKAMFAVLLIGTLTMGYMIFSRVQIEDQNMQVDIVLDYDEFYEMSAQSDMSVEEWFVYLREQGIERVALKEESLNSLVKYDKPLQVSMMGNLLKELDWKDTYPEAFVQDVSESSNAYDVVAYTTDQSLFQFIAAGLRERYDTERFELYEEAGQYVVVLRGTAQDALFSERESFIESSGDAFTSRANLLSSKLANLGLGLDPQKVAQIQNSGLEVLPRPYSYRDWTGKKQVETTWEMYEEFGLDPYVYIFDSNQVLGFPDELDLVAEHMRQNHIQVGLIETAVQREHMEQSGINLLTDAVSYRASRVYSLQSYVQERYQYQGYPGAEEIENTLYRAVTERNVRIIYLKPLKYETFRYVTDPEAYELMMDNFKARIDRHGITLGESSTFDLSHLRVRHYALMGWGVAAGAALLFSILFSLKEKYQFALLVLGLGFVTALVVVVPSLADKVLAIGASVTFASLSLGYFCYQAKEIFQNQGPIKASRRLLEVGRLVLITSLISLVGAGYVAAILSDIRYLLEMDIYRGVNISQFIPIGFFLLFYLKYFGYKRKTTPRNEVLSIYYELKRLLLEDVKVLYVIIGGIVAVAGYIYVSRIGHESNVQATSMEILLRNGLEHIFIARPRLKEFGIGIPALTLGYYAARKNSKFLVFAGGFAAILGQTSIINTFSHLRTPIYMSVARTGIGLVLGFIIGWIGILMLELLLKLVNYISQKIDTHPLSLKS